MKKKWKSDTWPPERKVVLVWVKDKNLPFCGYMRYVAGDKDLPYWVVYSGNIEMNPDVVAWCDCLPGDGPDSVDAALYNNGQVE